ncbi:MAG: hypothetical protein U0736_06045 [Gemmataceae bacterium]
MRSLHDLLRDARNLLLDPLQGELAPLFAQEDRLGELTARLLVYGRQGPPDRLPPPSFAGEITPLPAAAFAPFRPAVAAWHTDPDSPVVVGLLADALATAGVSGVLVLLGQRLTSASLTDGRAVPPPRATLLASAGEVHGGGDRLSVAGRALAKHAHRSPSAFWGVVTGGSDEKNAAAERMLRHLLDQATWWNVFGHFKHETVFEVRVPTGHGARWGHAGREFIGFLEPFVDKSPA